MDALAALRLQIDWGADEALDDAPSDRRRPRAPPPAGLREVLPAQPAPAPASGGDTLDALEAALGSFDGCSLRGTAKSLVLRDGDPAAGLVLIGDAPSDDDDREGRPFSGPGGVVLDRVFASIGLDRSQMMMTMLVPWRPPGKRAATAGEIEACLPFLLRHLAIVRARRVVLFGGVVTRALGLGTDPISRLRGRWRTIEIPGLGRVDALPMRPVESSLSSAAYKRELWHDLIVLRTALAAGGEGESGR